MRLRLLSGVSGADFAPLGFYIGPHPVEDVRPDAFDAVEETHGRTLAPDVREIHVAPAGSVAQDFSCKLRILWGF